MQETIGIVGLGYVGLPVAVALGRAFPGTIGFDIDPERIAELRSGHDRTSEVSAAALAAANLRLSSDPDDLSAVSFYIIAVPTPIGPDRAPDLRPIEAAARTVGRSLSEGALVVVESTVWPGLTEELVTAWLAESSGLEGGSDFFVGYSPERINPGDGEHTFETVVKVLAAQDDASLERMEAVYGAAVKAGTTRAPSIRAAELSKLLENTQRDLNVALMNELALICDRFGMRTRDVLAVARTKWNFLPFEPGLVGGHCISVDPYWLTARAQIAGHHPEVILAGRRINDEMGTFVAQKTVKLLAANGMAIQGARVAVLGLTFKEDFPDVRNSLVRDLMGELLAFGVEVSAFDPYVDPAKALMTFGLEVSNAVVPEGLGPFDAIVLAVRHKGFLEHRFQWITRLREGGVLVDVKSALDPATLPDHVTYWSL
ncbi:MAG: nucleotide sugar dehydrogenase [Myxococcota bacterium]